jgi:HEAT repeat protein
MRLRPVALALLVASAVGGTPRPASADWADAKRQFLAAHQDPDWHARRTAYLALVDHDSGEAVSAMLERLAAETNPAVVAAGLDTLGKFKSDGARKAAIEAVRKGKASERVHAVVALSAHRGNDVDAALAEAAAGANAQAAAQAALALGTPGRSGASAALLPLLAHKDWQVRTAAARSLAAHGDRAALKPLADRLASEAGTARGAMIEALETISKEKLGDAPLQWKALAAGQPVADVKETATLPPTAFGVPITGQRVVFVFDRSLMMDDPHPFDRKRLEALCSPPDGEKISWFRLATKLQFAAAHLKHAIDGLPAGARFGLVHYCKEVDALFEKKIVPANAGNRKAAAEAIDALKADDGIDIYDALTMALDLGGAGEPQAWKSGPDQVLWITNNGANHGLLKGAESDLNGPAIGWKARLRMVPVHVVGIAYHPFTLAPDLAQRTGGTYVNLTN